jgi:hypothetical protein
MERNFRHTTFVALAIGVSTLTSAGIAQAAEPASTVKVLPTGAEDTPAAAAARRAASSEQQALQQELANAVSESSEGLKRVQRADGVVMVDLEGRFMSVAIATPSEDGGHAISCHTGDGALAHAKHAHDVASGKAPKAKKPPAKAAAAQPALEEK